MGKTMADWIGGWGFEQDIENKLENSIPPYLIHGERTSPFPFEASVKSQQSPRNAYELLNLELSCFVDSYEYEKAEVPENHHIQLEACRIIFASEVLFLSEARGEDISSGTSSISITSWLRDLILNNVELTVQAQFLPLRTPAEGRLRSLEITGEKPLFAECPLENQLRRFVENRLHQLVLTAPTADVSGISDCDLQEEACAIMTRMHQGLGLPLTDFVFNWLMTLARSSASWLGPFRQRTYFPLIEPSDTVSFTPGFADTPQTSAIPAATTGDYCVKIANMDINWETHCAIDSSVGSDEFLAIGGGQSCHHVPGPSTINSTSSSQLPSISYTYQDQCPVGDDVIQQSKGQTSVAKQLHTAAESAKQPNTVMYQMHDPNFNKWLGRQLARWVMAVMSPNNPSCHIPSDHEIQHHARCLLYNDDDPWNQTVADNMEWLRRFKSDVGILENGDQTPETFNGIQKQ
ncbi:hypothetical protein NQ176_g3346 [Zarea fungicola]|uniref:Uncharacterized protein n=1 Tax=Zarea fungicola TaxID=93591 RepID=A0ACC1NJQ0_9HYPO|nr:hypothetical protein NQ176_g3346 [Lecanicillium fungicola]